MEESQKQGKEFCVYMHTNKINGKVYIGQTCKKPEYRWNEGKGYVGCTYFYNAIQKYGWDNFEHEILYSNLTLEEANEIETKLIAEYNSTDPNKGYNLTTGGKNGKHSETTKKKLSEIQTGEHRSEETRRRISEARKGMEFSANHRENLSKSHKGKRHSKETRQKMSEVHRKRVISEDEDKSQKIPVLCVETNIVYYSINEAERQTGIFHGSIIYCCKGKRKTAGGYHWQYYKKEYIDESEFNI